MSEAARLYTPELLAHTLRLAAYPLDDGFPLAGTARSKSCGSTLSIGLATDKTGCIQRLGLRAQACAVGQAAAAIFADAATGKSPADIFSALADIRRWLSEDGEQPDWPGMALIAPARGFKGRHGAILLAWEAAAQALSQAPDHG